MNAPPIYWAGILMFLIPWLMFMGMTVLAIRENQARTKDNAETERLRTENNTLRRYIATLEEERRDHIQRYHPPTGHKLVRRG